ncbi:enoyl-CoA hydratase/isomerase family protein [Nocardia cyriacigeorgica]|uniref:enoyl-CoA hydratase/isomerase family protein n=1 Tax=Nocardia cyriacigeorgica TaxID=135487 RepID=UPI0024557F29|nr:enoyl-CoA hydratase/isomerase family protein [Nocardia cyriacigeorgica]
MSSELLVDVSAGIAVLTLNRPAQQNAFTPAMIAELSAALQRCDIEDAIRVVVITGTPAPLVCAGGTEAPGGRGGEARPPPPRPRICPTGSAGSPAPSTRRRSGYVSR